MRQAKVYEIIPGLFVRGHIRRIRDRCRRQFWLEDNTDVVVGMVQPFMMDVDKYMVYYYCPIIDGALRQDTIKILHKLADKIVGKIHRGNRVIIYCKRGRNRSCLMAALVTRLVLGISGKEALKHTQKKRPNSLANTHFANFLISLGEP